jgi:hypothetical protein
MQDRRGKRSIIRRQLAAVFAGTSSRRAWWLALGLLIGGLVLAYRIYDSHLSLFLRRQDAGATAKALLMAGIATGIFSVVTVRRANELRAGPRVRWTLLLPPFWVFWFPILGAMKPVTADAPDALMRLVRKIALTGAAATIIMAFVAVGWWMRPEPDVSGERASNADQAEIEPYDCIREGNRAMAGEEPWPLTVSGEDVFLHVIRRCAENERAF